jgi:hypothetical protein
VELVGSDLRRTLVTCHFARSLVSIHHRVFTSFRTSGFLPLWLPAAVDVPFGCGCRRMVGGEAELRRGRVVHAHHIIHRVQGESVHTPCVYQLQLVSGVRASVDVGVCTYEEDGRCAAQRPVIERFRTQWNDDE